MIQAIMAILAKRHEHAMCAYQPMSLLQLPHKAFNHFFGLQLFGCVDWAPSDLIATFLLAGAAQTCRRRSRVEIIAAAGGVPEAPPRPSPSRDGDIPPCTLNLCSLH